MKSQLLLVLILISTFCISLSTLGVSTSESSCEGVRRLLHFNGKLVETPLPPKRSWKIDSDAFIDAWKYVAVESNVFAPISIIVCKQGALVDDKFRSNSASLRTLVFTNKTEGYSGSMFGPGGSETIIWLHVPDRRVDMLVKHSIPGDPALARSGDSDDYLDLLGSEGDVLLNRLVECALLVMEHHNVVNPATNAANSIIPPNPEAPQNQAPPPAVLENMPKSKQALRALSQGTSVPVEASPQGGPKPPLLYIILLVVVVLLVGVCVRKYAGRKGPP